MDHSGFLFHRPQLAQQYVDSLEGRSIVDARSGLFLAAPRRTGKTTFVREDLLPTLVERGFTPVYVDLWTDRAQDPALLISGAIQAKLQEFSTVIQKLAQRVGSAQVTLFGTIALGLTQPGLPSNLPLAEALEALAIAAETPVALVIDEAQHALSTDAGLNAMFALKAARDRLMGGESGPLLVLVLTGSNRDKLAHLVRNKSQPFFGASITRFPLLEQNFVRAFTTHINRFLAADNQFSGEDLQEAFRLVGYRPELLQQLAAEIAVNGGAEQLRKDLQSGAHLLRQQIWKRMESEFTRLTVIQQAVLETLIEAGPGSNPFGEAFLQRCALKLGRTTAKLQMSSVQRAMDALREKNLVWRADWGEYVLEDESMADWHQGRRTPPE
ncbi:conserved protein of unknown function [Acidithiobacillus ferrivorans]|uniref:Conserved hypothethical protein n=1 Tax=Acidithiobacillus ferrivorans TaxID=160808 RepID=A0A060UQB4_9PROT|nr:hypothetical protein [Acidithiobacillus ferrivorans]CDQ10451.1 Conserved hypothethical protein [Acidithiobacillus ferrivorans]SMH64478.1 conserved protein of unknown function [Acidithiobacillus ferrivorans]